MITDGALIGRIHLEPTLNISGKTPSVSLRIGDKKMYVVKSIPELVQHVQQTEMHKCWGKIWLLSISWILSMITAVL